MPRELHEKKCVDVIKIYKDESSQQSRHVVPFWALAAGEISSWEAGPVSGSAYVYLNVV